MTTIVLTIVGILLAAAAALMVLWYGGSAFDGGTVKADANTIVNNIQQFENAARLYEASTGLRITSRQDLDALVPQYVLPVPRHRFWESATPAVATSSGRRLLYSIMYDEGREACSAINLRHHGSSDIPVITNWTTQLDGRIGCYETGEPLHILVLWARD